MTTLKALDGQVQLISGKGELFYSEAQRFVEKLKNYSTASSHYKVISIIGPQSSGKSHMLNTLFGTKFVVLNAAEGSKQTTKGIWIAKCVNPCMIIMDVEGMDGTERGEDDTLFERQSALFSLTLSDVLLLNMWFHDIGRVKGANWGLIKLIFEQRVKIEAPKTTIIILVRDYNYETPPDITNKKLNKIMNELWEKVHPAPTDKKMSDYIEVIVKDIPHKNQKQEFSQKTETSESEDQENKTEVPSYQSKKLAEFLCSFAANESLEKNHGASGFAHSSKLIWDLICSNKRLSVTNHKLAMSAYLCNEIKNEIVSSFHQDREYWCLMTGTSITSVKEFNTKLLFFVKRISARYEEDCRAFDSNTRKEVWDKLEEEILQGIKQAFKYQIDRLYNEKLYSAKYKVHAQLLKLFVRDHSSVIGVTRPYLQEFNDNLPSDVHPYFKKVLNKRCKKFEEELTRIAEEEENRITEEEKNKIAQEQDKKMQMLLSSYVLYKIKDDILDSFDPEGYASLTVKEFNIKLLSILERLLARYDAETRQIDENIKGNFRDTLEEQILRKFKPTFEDKLLRLSNEILTLAKSEVRRQLRKLPLLNELSVIGVLSPYLKNFDDNSRPDVDPYFQDVLNKHRKQFVEGLTKLGEKKGNKILIALRAAGASVACIKLIIGTTWAICTGDIVGATMLYRSAIGRNIGHPVKGVRTRALLMDS